MAFENQALTKLPFFALQTKNQAVFVCNSLIFSGGR